jgi:hypothetical protein
MRKGHRTNRARLGRLLVATAVVLVVGLVPATASASPPSNDNFANAQVLTERFGWVEGDTTDATKEPGEPNHAGNPGGASVWYRWTAPHTGTATLNLCWAEFDTLLAVYTGGQVGQLEPVAADDDGCGDQSRLTFVATAGVTYQIAVDGADGASGYFELDWGLAPPNDFFAASGLIAGDAGTAEGDNRYATLEPGEPEHGSYGSASVWYRWTAPSTGPATFDLCDSDYFDSLLAVYTGGSIGTLTRVAQDDNDCPDYYGSRVSFNATAGQEYRIAIDGAYGEQGSFALRWSRVPLAPRNHLPPSLVGRALDGSMLTAGNGEWGGTPPLTFGYQWTRCSVYGSSCQAIPGATGATYVITSADVHQRLQVLVTASNSAGSATAESGLTGIVSAVAPVNITPPTILGRVQLGEELTVNEGQWSGTQPFTFSYLWQRCGSVGCSAIDEETVSTHIVGRDDLNSRLMVVVTATNGAGSVSVATSQTSRITRRLTCLVPRLAGKKLAVARRAVRRAHCSVGRVRYARSRRARGRVVSQSPRAGARKPAGTKVNLVVSRGR